MALQIGFALCTYLILTTILLILYKFKSSILTQLSGWFLSFYIFFDFFSYFIAQIFPFFSPVVIPAVLFLSALTVGFANDHSCIKKLVVNKVFIVSFIVAIYFLASSLLGSNPTYGFKKWSILLFKGYFAGLTVAVLSISFRRLYLKPVIYCGIVCALLLIFLGGENPIYPNRRVFGTANPIWESRSFFLLITLCLWYTGRSLFSRITAGCVGFYGAYLTGSRGPFAAAAIVNALIFSIKLFSHDAVSQIKRIMGLSIVVLICCLALLYFNMSFDDIIENQPRLKTLLDGELLEKDPNVVGRLNAQRRAIKLWKKNIVFGTGLGGFSRNDQRYYPHNLIIEILCEGGIIGSMLWISMIVLMWITYGKTSILRVLFLQSVIYTISSGDFGSNFEYVVLGLPAISFEGDDYEN